MNEARVSCLERSARCSIGQIPEPLLEKLAGQAMGRRKYAPEAFVKVRKTHIAVFFVHEKFNMVCLLLFVYPHIIKA